MAAQVSVELLAVAECPHVDAARTLLSRSLRAVGVTSTVVERVGDFPSPTVLVNGKDVMTGAPVPPGVPACRLDVPTAPRLMRALQQAAGAPSTDRTEPLAYPAELAVGVTRDRIATVSSAAPALHQTILRGFESTGTAPDPAPWPPRTPPASSEP